jgi:squalene synthase HpnC
LPVDHYENFPVASVALPARLRAPVEAIYRFARSADDLADEGDATPVERLAALAAYREALAAIAAGDTPDDPVFGPLATVLRSHALPLAPFHDLLDAFEQDVSVTRYAHFGEVMDYCRRSANPVGRLMLHLYGDADPRHQAWSDAICSSLQLTNFLQDIAIDFARGRVYLPQDELLRHHLSDADLAPGSRNTLWPIFMRAQIERTRRLLQAGAPLALALKGRIGLELRMTVRGAEAILKKLHADPYVSLVAPPRLRRRDWLLIVARALVKR